MLLYDLTQKFSLQEFGIEIPLKDDRVTKTLEYLANHPVLGSLLDRFSVKVIDEEITREDLLRVHSRDYVDRLFSEKLEQEVLWAYELIDDHGNYHRYNPANARLPLSLLLKNDLDKAAGVLQCCKLALQKGFCFYFGGGSHHAQADFGNGFCIVNDIVIALRNLQANQMIEKAWVIDVDAHKGDGTAALTFRDNSITTLSIHMAKGWPLDGPEYIQGGLNPSFISSDIDIPIESGEEDAYLERLEKGLKKLEALSTPQIALVVLGADPYEKDELPSTSGLRLSLEQMKKRDLMIYRFLKERDIPQAHLMAGGYGAECWQVYANFLEHVLLEQGNR
ncbi:MAG: histone deacetylase [Clostridia bacterium]|nr:histone deacetylase [Clostridia bacterium]